MLPTGYGPDLAASWPHTFLMFVHTSIALGFAIARNNRQMSKSRDSEPIEPQNPPLARASANAVPRDGKLRTNQAFVPRIGQLDELAVFGLEGARGADDGLWVMGSGFPGLVASVCWASASLDTTFSRYAGAPRRARQAGHWKS